MSEGESRVRPQFLADADVFRRQAYIMIALVSLMLIGRPELEGRRVLLLIDLPDFVHFYLLLGLILCFMQDYVYAYLSNRDDSSRVESAGERSHLIVVALFLMPGIYIFGQLLEVYLGRAY